MFSPNKLKQYRKKIFKNNNHFMYGLARRGLYVSRQTLDNYENGATSPDANTLFHIAQLFERPMEDFFSSKN